MHKYGWDWPQLYDPRRDRSRRLGSDMPHVVAIDAQGRIVGGHHGLGNEAVWELLAAKLR